MLSRLKIFTGGKLLWTRTIGSTIVGEGLDTLIFITIAFAGLPFSVLIGMMIAQYLWKVGYEVVVTPLTYLVVGRVKRLEGIDSYDTKENYNPFRLRIQNERI